ncbi:interferon regulatory factor 4-like [Eumetopias jubatus]|uniref:interferon regulatory factor 4-like n=1 Tax=Eumetopias jubatus TaxID=34886 RepID=UPI00101614AA|nr:interferon regulatory factor 4-like [Eumetopias jubatus]
MAGDPWRREEGKGPDGGRPMAGAGGPLRLRDWLVAQTESGRCAGLCWEDAGKTLFRIPWKHAARQGYRAQRAAALFRAWAIHKCKHLEGIDKEDPPPTWKTRLRCALSKSADFCEVPGLSQPDSPSPYRVYQMVADGARGPGTILPPEVVVEDGSLGNKDLTLRICTLRNAPPPVPFTSTIFSSITVCITLFPPDSPLATVVIGSIALSPADAALDDSRSTKEDEDKEQSPRLAQQGSLPPTAWLPASPADHRYQAQDPTHHWSPLPSEDFGNLDCWLHVRLSSGAQLVRFPEPGARELQRLGRHLQRGVLAERLCRSRGDRRGPLGPLRPHRAPPHKLERGRTCQLLDTRRFLEELRAHLQDGRQEPEYQIRLCFGKEYPGPPDRPEERLIMAHVEPVFASELFLHSSITTVVSGRWQVPSPASPDGVTHLLMQLSQQ